jgi:hypothetical protein
MLKAAFFVALYLAFSAAARAGEEFDDCVASIQKQAVADYASQIQFSSYAAGPLTWDGSLRAGSEVVARGALVNLENNGKYLQTDVTYHCDVQGLVTRDVGQPTERAGGAWLKSPMMSAQAPFKLNTHKLFVQLEEKRRAFKSLESLEIRYYSSDADSPSWIATYLRETSLTNWTAYRETALVQDDPRYSDLERAIRFHRAQ